ncbi:hypothetical protein BJX76DRAFT_143960 [Aspergillus varians]
MDHIRNPIAPSRSPFAASSARVASSRVNPSSVIFATEASGQRDDRVCTGAGRDDDDAVAAELGPLALGPWPPAGWVTAPVRAPTSAPSAPLIVGSSSNSSSRCLGISASPRNGTAWSWITSAPCLRSMQAWWRLNMSRPKRRSMCFPSITVNEQGRNISPILI